MNRYDWSKLDAGWTYESDARVLRRDNDWFRIGALEDSYTPDDEYWAKGYTEARTQLTKCRIRDTERAPVDNTPLFEAMDRMSVEIPAEEWAKVPPISNGETVSFTWDPDSGRMFGEPQVIVAPTVNTGVLVSSNGPILTWQPSQPWRRGPLASWTLVNISSHDGRLTVVMKRGRGELVMETGPDDETLWERLAQKVEGFGE